MEARIWLEKNWETFLSELSELIAIPSVSRENEDSSAPFGNPCAQVLQAIQRIGSRMGFVAENHDGYFATLLWQGESTEEIGIFAHLDVVPEGTGWKYPPYQATILDDKIIGRGSCDNKGPALSTLYALLYLKSSGFQPKHSIRFFFGVNEEAGMKDIKYFVSHCKMPAFSFTPDASFPVCHGEKGGLNLTATYDVSGGVLKGFTSGAAKNAVPALAVAELALDYQTVADALAAVADVQVEAMAKGCKVIANGIASHAAFPEGSKSAQVVLADALLKTGLMDDKTAGFMKASIAMFSDYYGKGMDIPLEDEPSGKLTHVGGTANLDDGVIRQTIDIRYPVTADREAMMQALTACLEAHGFKLVLASDSKPCYIPKDTEIIRTLTDICNTVLGMDAKPYTMGGGTYARHLVNAVGYGPGVPGEASDAFGPGHGGGHQPDEYITFDKLRNAYLIYVKAIPEMDRLA